MVLPSDTRTVFCHQREGMQILYLTATDIMTCMKMTDNS